MNHKRSRTSAAAAAAAAAEPSVDNTISLISSSEDEDEDDNEEEDVVIVKTRATSPRAPGPAAAAARAPAASPQAPRTTDVKEHLKCNICFEVFHDPVLLVPCAHVYCGGCFSGWVSNQDAHRRGLAKCPACRHDVSMVLSAPKNLTCIVDDYLKQHPTERRTPHDLSILSKQDTVPRNSSLARFQQHNQQPQQHHHYQPNPYHHPAPISSANVQVFAQIFSLPHGEASRLLALYQSRGYSNDQAVEHYMTAVRRT